MGKDSKPRGKLTAYSCFVQTCREEHKKKHPGEQVVFAEFSKTCAAKWKTMNAKEKKRFEDIAEKDKTRYEKEMASYDPPAGGKKRKSKQKKDPNAPKRPLSAFFLFCQDERPNVRKLYPDYPVGDVAKELGKRWEACTNRSKYEALAVKAKQKYDKDVAEYKKSGGGAGSSSGAKKSKPEKKAAAEEEEDDDDEEEDDDEDDD